MQNNSIESFKCTEQCSSNPTLPGAILHNPHNVLHQLTPDLASQPQPQPILDRKVSHPCVQDVDTSAIGEEDEAGFLKEMKAS